MSAVRMVAWAEVRRRWRGLLVLTLVVGVVGATVLATAAGARRSETALSRFNQSTRSADVQVFVGSLTPPTATQIRELAHVRNISSFAVLKVFSVVLKRAPDLSAIAAATDTKFATVVDRSRLVAGRQANPAVADEITIGTSLAAQKHLHVGDHLDGFSYTAQQIEAAFTANSNPPGAPSGPSLRLRIVGIVERPLDLGNRGANGGVLVETPAFYRKYLGRIGSYGTVFRVRTTHGAADVAQVAADTKRIFASAIFQQVSPLAVENDGAQDAISVLTAALWIFAAVAAVSGTVAIAIMLGREVSVAGIDQPTLRALGFTRRQRTAVGIYPGVLVAGAGSVLAVLGAIAVSPLFPFGVARRADPDPGLHLDSTIVLLGALTILIVVVAVAFVSALASTRARGLEDADDGRRRPSAIVELAAGSGLTPSATNGLRMALERGRGRTAVPVRSAYVGAVVGIAGLVAVAVFASSVHHLAASPRLYGWTADYAATDNNSNNSTTSSCGRADYGLGRTRGIAAVAAVCTAPVQIAGHTVTGFGFVPLRRTIEPEVLTGRLPNRIGEAALGTVTLDTLGKHVGDAVRISGPHGGFTYRIVGRVALPELGAVQPLADGAIFTDPGLERVADQSNSSRYLLMRFAPGADRTAIEHRIAKDSQDFASPVGVVVPPEVDRLRQIDWFPAVIAGFLAALALIAVGHALVTAVRRRRRDLALLKTLGFDRRQVRATIAWQATTIAAVGLLIGIPAGIVLGRLVWHAIADSTGVSTSITVPGLALAAMAVAAVLLANIVASMPARTAARTRPAVTLRTE
jgi:ABC-type lipoprotein release transport system permease subunit